MSAYGPNASTLQSTVVSLRKSIDELQQTSDAMHRATTTIQLTPLSRKYDTVSLNIKANMTKLESLIADSEDVKALSQLDLSCLRYLPKVITRDLKKHLDQKISSRITILERKASIKQRILSRYEQPAPIIFSGPSSTSSSSSGPSKIEPSTSKPSIPVTSAKTHFTFDELVLNNQAEYIKLRDTLSYAEVIRSTYDVKDILIPFAVRYILNKDYDVSNDYLHRLLDVLKASKYYLNDNPQAIDDPKFALQLKLIVDNLDIASISPKLTRMQNINLKEIVTLIQEALKQCSINPTMPDARRLISSQLDKEVEFLLSYNIPSGMEKTMNLVKDSISDKLTTDMILAIHDSISFEDAKAKGFRVFGTKTGFEHISFNRDYPAHLRTDKYADVTLTSVSSGSVFGIRYFHPLTRAQLIDEMNVIVSRYHDNLSRAVTAQQKFDSIIGLVAEITQLHPFRDGNTRTYTYAILNRESINNGFSPTILDNPHLFKSRVDHNVLAEAVAEGTEKFRQQMQIKHSMRFKQA